MASRGTRGSGARRESRGRRGSTGSGSTTATAQVEKWPATPLKRTAAGESSLVTATQPSALGAAPPAQSGKAR